MHHRVPVGSRPGAPLCCDITRPSRHRRRTQCAVLDGEAARVSQGGAEQVLGTEPVRHHLAFGDGSQRAHQPTVGRRRILETDEDAVEPSGERDERGEATYRAQVAVMVRG